jgi:hypothetical protein
MTTTIWTEFVRALGAPFCVLGGDIVLFVYNHAAHAQDTPFLRNVQVVYNPPNLTSTFQPLDLCIVRCFKQWYWKHLTHKSVI